MDETPDQILARLQRHAESVRHAKGGRAGPGNEPRLPGTRAVAPPVAANGSAAPASAPTRMPTGPSTTWPSPDGLSTSGPSGGGRPQPAPAPVGSSTAAMPSRALLRGIAGPGPNPVAEPAAGPRIVVWGDDRAADLIPVEIVTGPRLGLLARTIAGQAVAVVACLAALILSIASNEPVTTAVSAAIAAAALVAAARRVPFAGWWLLGWVLGWLLGRFS